MLTKTSLLVLILIIQLVTSFFAAIAGFTVHSAAIFAIAPASNNPLDFVTLFWNVLKFVWDMATYSVVGVPAVFSLLWDFMLVMTIWILVTSMKISIDIPIGSAGGGGTEE